MREEGKRHFRVSMQRKGREEEGDEGVGGMPEGIVLPGGAQVAPDRQCL